MSTIAEFTANYKVEALKAELRNRFHSVIISRGYSEVAAQGILDEWFPRYIQDVDAFKAMLDGYEKGTL
jgi:hypothetical protein